MRGALLFCVVVLSLAHCTAAWREGDKPEKKRVYIDPAADVQVVHNGRADRMDAMFADIPSIKKLLEHSVYPPLIETAAALCKPKPPKAAVEAPKAVVEAPKAAVEAEVAPEVPGAEAGAVEEGPLAGVDVQPGADDRADPIALLSLWENAGADKVDGDAESPPADDLPEPVKQDAIDSEGQGEVVEVSCPKFVPADETGRSTILVRAREMRRWEPSTAQEFLSWHKNMLLRPCYILPFLYNDGPDVYIQVVHPGAHILRANLAAVNPVDPAVRYNPDELFGQRKEAFGIRLGTFEGGEPDWNDFFRTVGPLLARGLRPAPRQVLGLKWAPMVGDDRPEQMPGPAAPQQHRVDNRRPPPPGPNMMRPQAPAFVPGQGVQRDRGAPPAQEKKKGFIRRLFGGSDKPKPPKQ